MLIPVDVNCTGGRIIETCSSWKTVDLRPQRATERDRFARLHMQVEFMQCQMIGSRRIGKVHILKAHPTLDARRKCGRLRRSTDGGCRVENLEEAFGSTGRALQSPQISVSAPTEPPSRNA